MRLPETRDLFVRRLTFPTDREEVTGTIGDVEIEAPMGDNETIEEVLDRQPSDEFASADELYDHLVAFLGDQHVGRKHYDDRGSQAAIDNEEVSF